MADESPIAKQYRVTRAWTQPANAIAKLDLHQRCISGTISQTELFRWQLAIPARHPTNALA
jgi:hypothetical protein